MVRVISRAELTFLRIIAAPATLAMLVLTGTCWSAPIAAAGGTLAVIDGTLAKRHLAHRRRLRAVILALTICAFFLSFGLGITFLWATIIGYVFTPLVASSDDIFLRQLAAVGLIAAMLWSPLAREPWFVPVACAGGALGLLARTRIWKHTIYGRCLAGVMLAFGICSFFWGWDVGFVFAGLMTAGLITSLPTERPGQ